MRAWRPALALAAAAALLAGPTVLAFAHGGYFAAARITAALAAWALAALAAVVAPRALPAGWPGRLSLLGLAGLLIWTLASIDRAPLHGPGIDDAQRLTLYLGALLAAAALLRGRAAAWVEPALAAGAVAVVGYGLSERLLPGLIDLETSRAAVGRLEQPLSYWNATGALAGMGIALCARLAGDLTRPAALRLAAAAAAAPLGAGLLLAYSRGAIAATFAGLIVLALLVPERAALRSAAVTVAAALLGAAAAATLPAVHVLDGPAARREGQGLALLAALVALGAAAAWLVRRWTAAPSSRAPVPRAALAIVVAGSIVLAAAGAAAAGPPQSATPETGATAARLGSVDSNRYLYWKVAVRAFGETPLTGRGPGSFGAEWLRERTVPETVRDAHSLELETAAELGLVGLACLALMLGGTGVAAARARHDAGARVAGAAAALAVWTAHSALDWDWEVPALTLVAVILAGTLIAAAEPPVPGGSPARRDVG